MLTIPTGRNLPKITGQSRSAEPSIINDKTIADFTRVVEQTGILRGDRAPEPRQPEERRPMPELTRRRSADHGNNCWHIYCGNVHVGTIAERTGNQEAAAVEFVFKYGVAPITMRLLDTATRTDDWKTDPDKIRDGILKSSEGIARVIVCLSLPSKLLKAA